MFLDGLGVAWEPFDGFTEDFAGIEPFDVFTDGFDADERKFYFV